ncbi:MAG: hypothetical protein ACYDCL_15380 [Myxococcales bacterium]
MEHAQGLARLALLAAASLALPACPPSASDCADAGTPVYGGPVPGPVDGHCYVLADGGSPGGAYTPRAVQWSSCGLDDAGICTVTNPDGSDGGTCPEYGPTNDNAEADDDDCKYRLGWWSTPIQYNAGGANATCDTGPCVTFFVSAKYALDGSPMTGDPSKGHDDNGIIAEIESNSGNGLPPPNVNQAASKQIGSGVFQIGPYALNEHGQWQVRFHLNEQCFDSWPSAPHGHAAFYFTVP